MFGKVTSILPCNKQTAFSFFADKGFQEEESDEAKYTYKDDRLVKIEMPIEVSHRRAIMHIDVTHYEPYEEVRFYSGNTVFETGESVGKGIFFPFNYMEFRTTFFEHPEGCRVVQEVYIDTKGIPGWILCKLFIIRGVKRELVASANAFRNHLKSTDREGRK